MVRFDGAVLLKPIFYFRHLIYGEGKERSNHNTDLCNQRVGYVDNVALTASYSFNNQQHIKTVLVGYDLFYDTVLLYM